MARLTTLELEPDGCQLSPNLGLRGYDRMQLRARLRGS